MARKPKTPPPTVLVRLVSTSPTQHIYSADGLHPAHPTGHLVYVDDPALCFADRRDAYGLADDRAALGQIMAEHYERLNGTLPADLEIRLL